MKKKITTLFLVFGLLTSLSVKAQSLEETLSKLSSTAGSAYVKPVISAFGSNLNSGWVSILPSASKLAFHIDLKVVAMGSFFGDESKTYNTTDKFYFSSDQVDQILNASGINSSNANYNSLKNEMLGKSFDVNFSGPTIVGKKNDFLIIHFPGSTIQGYNMKAQDFGVPPVKGFLDELPIFPTAAVQLTVGTVFGTNVAFRYFPDTDIKNMGKFSFFGVGAIHNPGVWFPNPIPVDIGIGYFIQKMKVGDIFESNASQFGLYVSKTVGFIISFTPYAGFVAETSKTTVAYNYQSNQNINGIPVPPVKLKFDLEGENKSGFVVGFNLHLAAININADYKISKTKTASAGVSFGL